MARGRNSLEDAFSDDEATSIAQYLKERIYATITGLAIVLVYANTPAEHDAAQALFSLVIGVVGITAAGYLSDVIAHMAVHKTFPSGKEQRQLLRVAIGALSTLVAPVIFLALALLDVMKLETALRVDTILYLVTLGVIGYGAVRRTDLSWWLKLLALGVLVLFGAAVVGVQVLAHSV